MSSYLTFFVVMIVGGSMGGILQAFRSTSSYTITLPSFQKSSGTRTSEPTWNTGVLGFIFGGIIGAFVLVGLIHMGTTYDLNPIYKGSANPPKPILMPSKIFTEKHEKFNDDLQQIVRLIVAHNSRIEADNSFAEQAEFWAWVELLALSILGGFGGVALVTRAYDKYVEDELKALSSKLNDEIQMTSKNTVEILLGRVRDMLENEQNEEAVALCDEILSEHAPNNGRAFGIKASALRRLEKWDEAISTLENGLAIAEMESLVRGKMYWNLACYKTLQCFRDGVPDDDQRTQHEKNVMDSIRMNLKAAIEQDKLLRYKLRTEKDLQVLYNEPWFDKMSECT